MQVRFIRIPDPQYPDILTAEALLTSFLYANRF
jgi:hypothetical protein